MPPSRFDADDTSVEMPNACSNNVEITRQSLEDNKDVVEQNRYPVCPNSCLQMTITGDSFCNGLIPPGSCTILYGNDSVIDGGGFESDEPCVLRGIGCPRTASRSVCR